MYSSMAECSVLKQHEEKIVIFCDSGINRASVETNENFYLLRLLLRADWGKCLMGSCFWNNSITVRERNMLLKIEWAIMKRRLVATSVNGSFCPSFQYSNKRWGVSSHSNHRISGFLCFWGFFCVTSELVCWLLCLSNMGVCPEESLTHVQRWNFRFQRECLSEIQLQTNMITYQHPFHVSFCIWFVPQGDSKCSSQRAGQHCRGSILELCNREPVIDCKGIHKYLGTAMVTWFTW